MSNFPPVGNQGAAGAAVPVQEVGIGGNVQDENTATDIAAGAADNHDYDVVNSSFRLKRIDFSSAGPMKIRILSGPIGSLILRATRFTSSSNPADFVAFDPPSPVASGGRVRVMRTNESTATTSLYSTIMGNDT